MLIGKNSSKESYENHNKANTSKGEYIECLIHNEIIGSIYPEQSADIEQYFSYCSYPKYLLMNLVENNQKCEVDEWKDEHNPSI